MRVVDLGDPSCAPEEFGGKASRLSDLLCRGFTVPPGVCLSAHDGAELPDGAEESIRLACRRLKGPLAVRSSALSEDSSASSFAGQFRTELNVDPSEVIPAVRRCRASAATDQVRAYAGERREEATGGGLAVLIQEMVPAERAGVLFSGDPRTQNPLHVVIEAVPGTGERLVGGEVEPETVVVDRRTGEVVERRGRSGVLAPDLIRALVRLALDIERHLGEPADIEWAWSRATLHLLQARPITNFVRFPIREKAYAALYVWTHANFAETMAHPVSPMGWSLMERLARTAIRPLRLTNAGGYRLFETLFGRAHWNITYFFKSRFLLELLRENLEILAPSLEGDLVSLFRRRRVALRRIFTPGQVAAIAAQLAVALPHLLGAVASAALAPGRSAGRMERLEADLRHLAGRLQPHETWPGTALALDRFVGEAIAALKRSFAPSLVACISSVGIAIKAFQLLGGSADGGKILQLIGEREPDFTVRAQESLWRLVRECGAEVRESIRNGGRREVLVRTEEGRAFLAALDRHLERFGHRGPNEQDVRFPRLAEDPAALFGMLRNLAAAESSPPPEESRRRRERERRKALEERLAEVPPVRRMILRALVEVARRFYHHRENGKFYLMLAFQAARRALLAIGRQMAAAGALARAEEVFFLSDEELVRWARNPSVEPAGIRARLAERLAEHRRYAKTRVPLLVTSEGILPSRPRASEDGPVLRGTGVSAGRATGRVRVVRDPARDGRLEPGEILVAPHTDPGWTPFFLTAAAVVTEVGGALSHGAVVAREFGLPAVVNVREATSLLRDGQIVTVDGDRGEVIPGESPRP